MCECVSCCWDGGGRVSCAEAAGFRCRWTGDEMIWLNQSLLNQSVTAFVPNTPLASLRKTLPTASADADMTVFSLHFHLLLSLFSNRK